MFYSPNELLIVLHSHLPPSSLLTILIFMHPPLPFSIPLPLAQYTYLFLLFRHFALRSYLFFLFLKIPFWYWHSFIIFRWCPVVPVYECNKQHTWLQFYWALSLCLSPSHPHTPVGGGEKVRQGREADKPTGRESTSILFLIKCVLLFVFLWWCDAVSLYVCVSVCGAWGAVLFVFCWRRRRRQT